MAGYSDSPYRRICRSTGAPYCTTEAILDRQMLLDGRLRRRLVQLTDDDHPVAAQIMGNDPAVMAQAARILADMGFDVIDLNFACPVRKVISRRRGGHMMRQPTRSLEIIRSVLAAVPDKPVTVKLRRAYLESDLTYDDFWTIARGAFDAGAAALCVHARSVEQKYMGQADWAFLSAVRQSFPDRTIIGSGDVHSAADALRMIQETGVDGVTAARGAIGNPWLFLQARQLADGAEPMHQRSPSSANCSPDISTSRYRSMENCADPTSCENSESSTPACTPRPPRSAPLSSTSNPPPSGRQCWMSSTRDMRHVPPRIAHRIPKHQITSIKHQTN